MSQRTFHIPVLLLIAIGGAFLGGFSSCVKTKTTLTITGVRADLPAPNDTTLSLVNPGQFVVIKGTGLTAAEQVLFDGVPATYNSALTAPNTMVIPVPSIAFSTIDSSQLNTITIIYAGGTVVYKFPVVPPPPSVTYISNEFAHPGDVITVTGNYLYLIQSITFPGNVPATQYSSNTSGTTLTLTVPQSATTGGGITIVTAGGTGSSEPAAGYNDPRGMLCNFDDVNSFSWGCSVVDSPSFTGNRGNFGQVTAGAVNPGDYAWYNGTRSINLNPVQWIDADSLNNPIGDYALKFEIFVKTPWTAGSLFTVPNYTWTYLSAYQPWATVSDSSIGVSSNWQTVVLPLSSFTTNDGVDGAPPANLSTFLGNGNQSLSIMFINAGTKIVGSYDVGIDNIRVVKVQ
jgi:hypothetical protein